MKKYLNQKFVNAQKDYHKLKPLCFKKFPMTVTNDGMLLPCCFCDDPPTRNDPEFKKLMKVSHIKDYDDIEEIFYNKEWIDFYRKLEKNIAPVHACYFHCAVKKDGTPIRRTREDTHMNTKTGVVKKIRTVGGAYDQLTKVKEK